VYGEAYADQTSIYALAVGVSRYPELGTKYQLNGPENDVGLVQNLFLEEFKVPSKNITILSEGWAVSEPTRLPCRENIEREFARLARRCSRGDHVVVFIAGHGSQQPEQQAGSEIDGLDEIFLPRDVTRWDGGRGIVPNAIVDDEISVWLQRITAKGAHLWAMFDCCHSGDLSRGLKDRERFVDPDDLAIPSGVLAKARQGAIVRDSPERTVLDLPVLKNAAIFYACQSHEKAIELSFGPRGDEEHYGLFTYSLNSVFAKARWPIAYRQVSREIYREYVSAGRISGPTPLVEGESIDRVILGKDTIERSPIRIWIDSSDEGRRRLRIDAGRLHGITSESVLAVSSSDAASGQLGNLVGYVRVTDVDITSANVESCEYAGLRRKTPANLARGQCQLVETDYGDLKMPVFVDSLNVDGNPIPQETQQRLTETLEELAKQERTMIKLVASPDARTWLLRLKDAAIVLVPPSEAYYRQVQISPEKRSTLGPFPVDNTLREQLATALARIARVENLMRLATTGWGTKMSNQIATPKLRIEQQVRSGGGESAIAHEIPWLQAGDILDISVTNVGDNDFDLTVLYVNSQMGIVPLYPTQNNVNRIRPGQTRRLPLAQFTDGPFGRNHFVFIAVPADGPCLDFTWLAQKTIPKARAHRSPIDALLETALFGDGKTRSVKSSTSCTFDILPVDVVKKQRSN
jgi:hypothetical protein